MTRRPGAEPAEGAPSGPPPAKAPLIGELPPVTHAIEPPFIPPAAISLPGPTPLPAVQAAARSAASAQAPDATAWRVVQRSVHPADAPPGNLQAPLSPASAARRPRPVRPPATRPSARPPGRLPGRPAVRPRHPAVCPGRPAFRSSRTSSCPRNPGSSSGRPARRTTGPAPGRGPATALGPACPDACSSPPRGCPAARRPPVGPRTGCRVRARARAVAAAARVIPDVPRGTAVQRSVHAPVPAQPARRTSRCRLRRTGAGPPGARRGDR